MNLHAIVSGAIGAVNPFVTLSIQQSTGSTTDATFARTPTFRTVLIQGQVQALNAGDLRMLEGLNIQGQARRVYVNGRFNGVVRATQKGGDLITTPDGAVWKITGVPEYWPDWCSFVMTLQNGS